MTDPEILAVIRATIVSVACAHDDGISFTEMLSMAEAASSVAELDDLSAVFAKYTEEPTEGEIVIKLPV